MNIVQTKMSVLLEGMFNGVCLFPCEPENIAAALGSLKMKFEFSGEDGFKKDAANLKGDWDIVQMDILNSYNTISDGAK